MLDAAAAGVSTHLEVWDEDRGVMRSAAEVFDELVATRPRPAELVVVHGDASTPNFVIDHGRLTGVVDLGDLGIGDPWFDLATCLKSMRRPGNGLAHEQDRFLEAYGVEPDPVRERWHRLLYALV